MGYGYLLLQALIFSFGGILIKTAAGTFSPFQVSFLRFAIGVVILLGLQLLREKRVHLTLGDRVIVFGGAAKALHYLGENYGVTHGFSYGNVIIWPVQTVVILLLSVLVLRERVSLRSALGAGLCVGGIGLLTWNGAPAAEFLAGQGPLLLSFVLAGVGAALFSVAQKKRLDRMGTVELNNSMFLVGGAFTALSLPVTEPPAALGLPAAAAMLILGAITALGFLLQAEALKTVPIFAATVVQSSTVLLSLVWAALLYRERITVWIILGAALFLIGILCVNLKTKPTGGKES